MAYRFTDVCFEG